MNLLDLNDPELQASQEDWLVTLIDRASTKAFHKDRIRPTHVNASAIVKSVKTCPDHQILYGTLNGAVISNLCWDGPGRQLTNGLCDYLCERYVGTNLAEEPVWNRDFGFPITLLGDSGVAQKLSHAFGELYAALALEVKERSA